MDCQFYSVKTYQVSEVRGVINEALRKKSACKHVPNPIAPNPQLMGNFGVESIPMLLRGIVKLSKAKTGKKPRKDLQLFMAGTTSYPRPPALIEQSPYESARYELWVQRTVKFLHAEYGDNLFAWLEHKDERFLHMHFFVMPGLTAEGRIVMDAHPGRNSNLQNGNANPSVKRQLYKQAMQDLQMRYYKAVGIRMGWSLKSEKPRKRVSREQWKETLRVISDKKILHLLGYTDMEIQMADETESESSGNPFFIEPKIAPPKF